ISFCAKARRSLAAAKTTSDNNRVRSLELLHRGRTRSSNRFSVSETMSFSHPERSGGISRNNLRRDPSTPLRSAQDDSKAYHYPTSALLDGFDRFRWDRTHMAAAPARLFLLWPFALCSLLAPGILAAPPAEELR